MIELIMLPPVFKGLIALLISSAVFPVAGVMIVRLNLLQMRFMLTHGVILGGAIALVMNISQLPVILLTNLVIVFFLIRLSDKSNADPGRVSAFLMVLVIGIAGVLMHKFKVPARDTMSIIWGSPFTLSITDLVLIITISCFLLIYIVFGFRRISAVFFNSDLALSSGINVRFHNTMIMIIIALTTAAAINLMGALLVDALMILPAFIAGMFSKSLKKTFINASVTGLTVGLGGFILALKFDLPLSGSISIIGAVVYICTVMVKRIKER